MVTPNFSGLLRKPELHLAYQLKYLKAENIGFKITDHFFAKTYVIVLKETGKTNNDLDLTNPTYDPSIQVQRHRRFGRCYTIHPTEKFTKPGLYYFKIWL